MEVSQNFTVSIYIFQIFQVVSKWTFFILYFNKIQSHFASCGEWVCMCGQCAGVCICVQVYPRRGGKDVSVLTPLRQMLAEPGLGYRPASPSGPSLSGAHNAGVAGMHGQLTTPSLGCMKPCLDDKVRNCKTEV